LRVSMTSRIYPLGKFIAPETEKPEVGAS